MILQRRKTVYQLIQKWITPGKSEAKNCLRVFVLAAFVTAVVFLPFLIVDKGLFLFYGDYNVQQIPFYQLAHDAIRTGNTGWSWTTDLGANFVGSYGFYLLGSPFFWLTIPFPTDWLPYLMAPLFVLKFATAATTGYAFLRRFTKTAEMAIIGAMLYAFSGFMVYDIFFNHFHEVVAFFPLLLIGIEELVMNKRRGIFALAVALNLMVNYFFFAGQVVFLCIYFFLRCLCPSFRINLKKFFFLAAETIIGVLIGLALFLPAAMAIMGNPRTDEMLTGYDMLFYGNVQRYGLILQSFFFPPDMPARPNFFPDSNSKWASVAAFLPLFSMTGVVTFLREKRKSWLKTILIVLFVMSLIPVLNSAFFAFNSSYYARWFYMLTLMMALATVHSLENRKMDMSSGIKFTFFVTLAFAVIGLLPKIKDGEYVFFDLPSYPSLFWISVLIALGCIALTVLLLKRFRSSRRVFYRCTLVALCGVIFVYSLVEITFGKMQNVNYYYTNIVDRGLEAEFELDDSEFFRIDVYDGMDNWPMYWGLPTIQAFQSVVPVSIMEFYPEIGVTRDVASRPDPKFYGVRELMSVKYIFVENNEDSVKRNPNLPPGFHLLNNQNGFDIYENENFLPMGFTYDHYIDQNTFEGCEKEKRDRLLLKGIYLNEEQIEKYGGMLSELTTDDTTDLTDAQMVEDTQARKRETCSSFTTDNKGFSAQIDLSKDNLVYFSVPYEKGWSATVNGQPVEIEQVNIGFMAVKCEAGANEIRFEYKTPGLQTGCIASIAGLVLFALYLLLSRRLSRKNPDEYAPDPTGHWAEREAFFDEPTYTELTACYKKQREMEESGTEITGYSQPPGQAEPDDRFSLGPEPDFGEADGSQVLPPDHHEPSEPPDSPQETDNDNQP